MPPAFPSQEIAPDDSHPAPATATRPQHHCHHAIVPSGTILDMLHQIDKHTTHGFPLRNLSHLVTTDMRLSLSTRSDSTPCITPLLGNVIFNTHLAESILDPIIIPTALPSAMILQSDPPHTAFCFGLLFYTAFEHFSSGAGNFFWKHINAIKDSNPDLAVGKYSVAPKRTWLNRHDPYGQQLYDGQRDDSGELIWTTFGGLRADGLEGIIMGSRVNEDFMVEGGEGVVSKAELFVMLIQLAYKAQRNEVYPTQVDLPQVMVINFTDEHARIVQGTLVRPCLDSNLVELSISVSANLRYLDEKTNTIIPDIWKQLLGWTFCRAVTTKRDDNAENDMINAASKESNEKLFVSKVRKKSMDDWEEALRKASKSTVSSVTRGKEVSAALQINSGRSSSISSSSSLPTSPS